MSSSYQISEVLPTFLVNATETDGCQQLGFAGFYRLRVGIVALHLLQVNSDREVTQWPLQMVKNYGYSSKTFFLQAGSRCKTGAGNFIFNTLEGENITQIVNFQANKLLNNSQKIKNKGKEAKQHSEIGLVKNESDLTKTHSFTSLLGNSQQELEQLSPLLYMKSKQAGSGKSSSNVHGNTFAKSDQHATGGNVTFPQRYTEDDDYGNNDMYCHLNRDGSRMQTNVYGMFSASAKVMASNELYENTKRSSDYDYLN